MSAVGFAYQELSSKNSQAKYGLDYLAEWLALYQSIQLGLRSIGPQAPKNAVSITKG